jgi:hypothetical protein
MLQSALSEGRLSQDEFNRRHSALYAAQTYGQLGSLTSDLTGGSASQAGPGYQQASGFGGAAQGSGFGTQGPLGFQSGADLGHAGNPGQGNPIGQQPGAGSPFQNALNQAGGNQPNLGSQGFGAQNQFGQGPSFGQGPDFGNQGLGNQFGNQGFGNQFGNQGFGNQGFGNQGYQDPNQPGYIIGNMLNNAKAQGLGQLMNSGLLGTSFDGPGRRRGRTPVGRIIRIAITFIGIGIALYFAFHHGHFETCTGDCGE